MIELERYVPSEHGEMLWRMYKDKDYGEFFRRCPKTWRKEDVLKFEELTGSQLFVCMLVGIEAVGFAVITNICWYGLNAQVGLMLKIEYRDEIRNGHKLAYWSMLSLADLFFNKMPLQSMSFRFLKKRSDIEKSLVKGGLRKDGEYPKRVLFDGNMEDELEYSLDKEKYEVMYR